MYTYVGERGLTSKKDFFATNTYTNTNFPPKRYVFEIRKRKLDEVMKLTSQAGIPGLSGGQGYPTQPPDPIVYRILQTLCSRPPPLALKIRGVRAQQCRQVSCPTVGNPITHAAWSHSGFFKTPFLFLSHFQCRGGGGFGKSEAGRLYIQYKQEQTKFDDLRRGITKDWQRLAEFKRTLSKRPKKSYQNLSNLRF